MKETLEVILALTKLLREVIREYKKLKDRKEKERFRKALRDADTDTIRRLLFS